jgi:hypothetical protein
LRHAEGHDDILQGSTRATVILKFATRSERLFALATRIPLLRKVLVYRTDAMPELRSAAVRDYVYRAFFTANATSKQTSAGRFADLDPLACSIIAERRVAVIHDVGVSSGVTSLDLYRTLATTGIPLSFHISDKYAVYRATGRCPVRIIDAEGSTRELYVCGLLGKREAWYKFPATRFLHWLLAGRPIRGPVRSFVLFDHEVLEYIRKGMIRRIDYDVFTTHMPRAFSFVRCMNLLNLGYFPPESIQTAVRNLVDSLQEGGVLQIGRTHPDGTNHAAFYRRQGARLEMLQEVAGGTELRELIDRL